MMEGMEGFFDLFSLIIAAYGVYFLYIWFNTVVRKKPIDAKILPTDLTMDTCNDAEQCTAYLLRWLLITGLSLLAYAAVSYFCGRELWFIWVIAGYFAVILTYYGLTMRTLRRRFWPDTVRPKKKKKSKQ